MSDHQSMPITETRNPQSMAIDTLSTLEMVRLINNEDQLVAGAVEKELPAIAHAIDIIADNMAKGGRLIYCGAGTSGRLGVLDASECPPTYGVPPSLVVGMIAGGEAALTRSQEGAEDDSGAGADDLMVLSPTPLDVVVGVSAGGGAAYVLGCVLKAREMGMQTVGVSCNANSKLALACDVAISPVVGPEVITGSTRMKAGTAQKMVLNMLSTAAMVRMGKVYSNLMVDMRASNEKLAKRALRIVMDGAGVDKRIAQDLLRQANGRARLAIAMHKTGKDASAAQDLLDRYNGRIADMIAREGYDHD